MVEDIIIRESGEGKIFNIDPDNPEHKYSISVKEVLKQHYGYLLKALKREKYSVDGLECMIFKEIVLIDKVVGFSTYIGASADDFDALALQFIYVLPEYRSNNLLVKDVIDTISFDKYVSIMSPTRFMVESLVNGGLAGILDGRFVISRIPFCVPVHEFTDSQKEYLKKEYNIPDPTGINRESSLYDLDYCAVVCPAFDGSDSAYNPLDENTNPLEDGFISGVLDVDDKYFDASLKRSEGGVYSREYFKLVSNTISRNNDKINDILG